MSNIMEKMPLDDVHVDELLSQMLEGRYVELHLEVGNPPHARARGAHRLDELKLRLGLDTLNPYESLRRPVAQRLLYDILADEQIFELESKGGLMFFYLATNMASNGDKFNVHITHHKGNVEATFHSVPSGS